MRLSFLIFLIAITGLCLYAPDLQKKAAGGIGEKIKSFQQLQTKQQKIDKDQIENLKNLQQELGFSPEKPMVEVDVKSPVLDKFAKKMMVKKDRSKTLPQIAEDFYLISVSYIKSLLSEHSKNITITAFFIAFIAFISKWVEIYKLAYLLGKLGWFFSRLVLFILSLAAILIYFTMKKNLWMDVGNILFLAPLQVLIASSVAFKTMDANFPVWNRLFGSFTLPAISGIITSSAYFL
ncbi:MAG: hypothetical protein JW983_07295 [Elusimicrobia bacterium]|nr:hypothetical protein [Elusimicrobiota bacterium]